VQLPKANASGIHPYHFLLSSVVDREYSTRHGKLYVRGRLFDVRYCISDALDPPGLAIKSLKVGNSAAPSQPRRVVELVLGAQCPTTSGLPTSQPGVKGL
jgi:hypothetical protein